MINLEKQLIKVDGVDYITAPNAAKFCGMKYIAFHAQSISLDTIKIGNNLLVKYDDVVEFNNHRLYNKALRERKNNSKKDDNNK